MNIITATEDAILATFAQYPETISRNLHSVTAEMFAKQNQPVFREIIDAALSGGAPDMLIITAKLRDAGQLDQAGGAYQMSVLFTSPVSVRNLSGYVATLRQHYEAKKRLETLVNARTQLETALLAGTDLREAMLSIDAMLSEAGKIPGKPLASKSMHTLANEVIEQIEARIQNGGKLPGISTGFPAIDAETQGMLPGKVWVVSGRPGDGKSVLMQNFVEAAIEQGKRVRVYPLEMSQQEQTYRIMCSLGGIDNQLLARGAISRNDQIALMQAIKRLHAAKAEIVSIDGAGASEILADIEQCDADVVMVDYLQLMEEPGGRKNATREEIISNISRRLKRTAEKTGKTVLTASQLNDAGLLRESRAIGQDADVLFRLEKVDGDDGQRVLVCDKLRGGRRFWELPLQFLGHVYRFREFQSGSQN